MTFGNRIIVPILAALNLLLFACSNSQNHAVQNQTGVSGKGVQIIGSDTMVNLVQAWAEAFSPQNPTVNLSIRGGGSGTGLAALINASCDLAMSSRPISDKEILEARQNNIEPKEWRWLSTALSSS